MAKRDPRAELNKTLAELEKHLGKDMIHPASAGPPIYHLAFRNPHLNYATEGGAPWNRYVSLYGDESTGKSLALYELMANAQALPYSMDDLLSKRISYHAGHGQDATVARLKDEQEWIHNNFPDGAECCFYDIEGQFDPIRAQKVGIDTDRLYIAELNVIEDICGTLSSLWQHFHIHGLDSTSNASSMLRLKQEPGKSLVGTEARQWKYALRDASTYFGPLKNGSGIPNMLVMVHQMSMNMNSGGAQQATGKYIKFVSSCSVKFTRGVFLWKKDGVLTDTKPEGSDKAAMAGYAEPDGVEVYAKIEKSRTCRPFRVASMQFDYKRLTYTPIHELASSGIYYGIIEKKGSWYSVDGENIGQGMKNVYEVLASDEELRDRIMLRLLDYTGDEGIIVSGPTPEEIEAARVAEEQRVQRNADLAAKLAEAASQVGVGVRERAKDVVALAEESSLIAIQDTAAQTNPMLAQ
jgi:recombination protein RecA